MSTTAQKIPAPGILLRQARLARGWTPQQLAEQAGIPLKTIRTYERRGEADAQTLQALSTTLDIPVHTLEESARRLQKSYENVIWLLVIFMLCLFGGYQIGSDLAQRDNQRDCIAAGRTDCSR